MKKTTVALLVIAGVLGFMTYMENTQMTFSSMMPIEETRGFLNE